MKLKKFKLLQLKVALERYNYCLDFSVLDATKKLHIPFVNCHPSPSVHKIITEFYNLHRLYRKKLEKSTT